MIRFKEKDSERFYTIYSRFYHPIGADSVLRTEGGHSVLVVNRLLFETGDDFLPFRSAEMAMEKGYTFPKLAKPLDPNQ